MSSNPATLILLLYLTLRSTRINCQNIDVLVSDLGTNHLTSRGRLCFFSKKNILIPNVAEKNILILVEEFLSYNLMLNYGK